MLGIAMFLMSAKGLFFLGPKPPVLVGIGCFVTIFCVFNRIATVAKRATKGLKPKKTRKMFKKSIKLSVLLLIVVGVLFLFVGPAIHHEVRMQFRNRNGHDNFGPKGHGPQGQGPSKDMHHP